MLEAGTMLLFCAVLFASVALGWSIIPALFVGVLLFMGYGLVRRCSLRAMASRAAGSVRSAGTVVVAFVLIGVLTSLWRASGTIAFIVAHSTAVIHAATVIPLSFLLCSAMSVLVGSSFASAATMGTICMSLGLSMQANPVMLGGAILAGVYVGDRCSPVSTSALLVKQLTHTNLFNTIARMLRTGAVPFVLSCVVYVAAAVVEWLCASGGSGFGAASAAATAGSAGSASAAVSTNASSITDIGGLFSSAFDLHWLTLVPALLVIVLALLHVDVRLLMLASIAASVAICVGVQHMEWAELLRLLIFGYHAQNPQVAALLDGGGILSMLTVMAIVCISSAYAGIFAETRMLARLQQTIEMLGHRLGACGATMITATCAAALACNQTLTIMLTHQLCGGLYGDDESERSAQAIDLEDSAVVIAPLIPWSIAGAVPLATINAPTLSLAAATFLYLLPLSRMLTSAVHRRSGFRTRHRSQKSKPGTHHPTPAQAHAPHVRS
ncbi:Na+/H+ antiporter NhaC family protein [Bifidobacterium longum subsp. longum]|uniref:Na+/H+ antiporter NhaC family protein n=1 Tax=Bifidobacterium longum TaxID=216816 RepID=UPI003D0150F2